MGNVYDKRNAIAKSAALARGLRLEELYTICEEQKTVSTKRLLAIVEKLHDDMRLDAIFLKELSKKID